MITIRHQADTCRAAVAHISSHTAQVLISLLEAIYKCRVHLAQRWKRREVMIA